MGKETKKNSEIHLTDIQINNLQKLLDKEDSNKVSIFRTIVNAIGSFLYSFFSLNKSGKWVSILTIAVVLKMFGDFLIMQQFSIEAMTLCIPYLSQIAITVFGIIGGVKGAESIIKKIKTQSGLVDSVKDIASKIKK